MNKLTVAILLLVLVLTGAENYVKHHPDKGFNLPSKAITDLAIEISSWFYSMGHWLASWIDIFTLVREYCQSFLDLAGALMMFIFHPPYSFILGMLEYFKLPELSPEDSKFLAGFLNLIALSVFTVVVLAVPWTLPFVQDRNPDQVTEDLLKTLRPRKVSSSESAAQPVAGKGSLST